MTPLRDKVRSLVREELLQAAESVFSEEGLQTAKVESIATRAGVSVGTVYNYFADRKALVDAVMESRREELFRRLQQLDTETEGHLFVERLEASVGTILEYFHAQRPYFMLMLQAEGSPFLKQAVLAAQDPCHGPFGSIYTHLEKLSVQGIAEGRLRDEDPKLLTSFLFGVCKGMALTLLADPTADVRDRKPVILRFFLHGAGPTLATPLR